MSEFLRGQAGGRERDGEKTWKQKKRPRSGSILECGLRSPDARAESRSVFRRNKRQNPGRDCHPLASALPECSVFASVV